MTSRRRLHLAMTVMTFALLLTYGCSAGGPSGGSSPAGSTTNSPAADAQTSSPSASSSSSAPTKLLVIVEENRSFRDVQQNMPYLTTLSHKYGSAADYYGLMHPSLPNYLVMAGGSTFGVTDDRRPAAHPLSGTSVFSQLLASGHTTKTYAEAMKGNCVVEDQGRYAVRHNPWTYFTDPQERTACQQFDVPAGTPTSGELATDIGRGELPDFSLVIPDICNDGHDCSAQVADTWLKDWLPVVQAGPDFQSGRLAIVVTWDEDDHTEGNHIATVVIHPSLNGKVVQTRLDHYALSAAISGIAGAAPLRDASSAPNFLKAFGLATG